MLNLPQFKPTSAGGKTRATFVRQDDPTAHLVSTGVENLYDQIQSYMDDTDYVSILEKAASGNPAARVRAINMMTESNPVEYPEGYDDRNKTSLRDVFDSIVASKSAYDKAGGLAKLGMSFQDFLSSVKVYRGQPVQPAAEAAPAASTSEGGDEQ